MRVAIQVEQLFQPSPGGIGRYIGHLLGGLPGLGLDVVAFSARHDRSTAGSVMGEGAARLRSGHLPRQALYEMWLRSSPSGGTPVLAPLIGLAARGGGPDVSDVDLIHAPSIVTPPPGDIPMIANVHDVGWKLFPEAFTPHGISFHDRALRVLRDRAALVITGSQAAADEISPYLGTAEVAVIHNGVDPPDLTDQTCSTALGRLGLSGVPYVLWVGSLEPRKNVGTLVGAVADLAAKGALGSTKLVLAGYRGWLSGGSIDPVDRASLGDRLVTLEDLADDDLWSLYRGARAFALPSLHEGFGLPLIEAMSQGAPVVCSDIPVFREIARAGDAGAGAGDAGATGAGAGDAGAGDAGADVSDAALFVAPRDRSGWADAIAALLGPHADASGRDRLSAAGRRRAGDFSVRAFLENTVEAYRRVGRGGT